jgi:hypothetical protein
MIDNVDGILLKMIERLIEFITKKAELGKGRVGKGLGWARAELREHSPEMGKEALSVSGAKLSKG